MDTLATLIGILAQNSQAPPEDDGVGIGSQTERMRKGTGLAGMRERVGLFGGELQLESRERGGTALVARLPLPTMHRGEHDDATNPRNYH